MKSCIRWPGGKGPLASWIVSLMPPHVHYVEPYFGAGSVLLAKDSEGVSEVANDLNGDLMNFWNVLQQPELFEEFRRKAEATPVSEWHWEQAAECIRSRYGRSLVDWALAFFIQVRQSLAGRGKCFTALSRSRTRRGMNEQASAWLTAVEGLPQVHERLKRIVLRCQPAMEVIRQEDAPDTLFYLDPPYLPSTRHDGGGEYGEHEMTEQDHRELLERLRTLKGKFLLSGYSSPLYNAVATVEGWRCHEKVVANHTSHEAVKGKEVECIWVNF